MKKKGIRLVKVILLLSLLFFIFGCASSPPIDFNEIPVDKMPNTGESLITVHRESGGAGFLIGMKIWIDNEEVATGIQNGNRINIVVPNGHHAIQAGSSGIDKGNSISFTLEENEEILFLARPAMGILAARFNLTIINKRKLEEISDFKESL